MSINKNEITREMLAKAMQCRTTEELMALAKSEGMEVTQEEAEAYLAEICDLELEEEELGKVAGGYNLCENYGQACPSYINVG